MKLDCKPIRNATAIWYMKTSDNHPEKAKKHIASIKKAKKRTFEAPLSSADFSFLGKPIDAGRVQTKR